MIIAFVEEPAMIYFSAPAKYTELVPQFIYLSLLFERYPKADSTA
jgi:hypothetical protein